LLDLFEKGKKQVRKLEMDVEKVDPETELRVKQILSKLDLEGWALIMDASQEILEEVTKDGVVKALLQIGMSEEGITETMSQLATDYAKQRGAELVGKRILPDGTIIDNPNAKWFIEQSTRDLLRGDVTRAVEEGWSTNKLRDALEENYAFSKERADMIARTETAFADVRGNMIAYKESGVVSGKEWICSSEGCCEEICELNAAKGVIPLTEAFPSGDMEPPGHPNCRCDVLPVLAEEAEA
jgi:SPP1 gp7 family putative phage head morphogenesis protein